MNSTRTQILLEQDAGGNTRDIGYLATGTILVLYIPSGSAEAR